MIELIKKLITTYYKSFILYFFVGGFCALIDWSGFYAMHYKLLWHYLLAGFIAFIVASTVNFFLCKLMFKSRGFKSHTEYILVILASTIALCIDLGSMYIFIRFVGLPAMVSKILGTGVAFIFNYLARQFFIFSSDPAGGKK